MKTQIDFIEFSTKLHFLALASFYLVPRMIMFYPWMDVDYFIHF